ncbi:fibrinogen C domain-containing protein 1-like [Haliotis rufescens]|uniref:fibrinogen C domain-containing protein 1-like n=1 Tax=Haliotis rufescens TaxID=6454 RepID=UPI00201F9388|nr:fibrinogen C domain-containing protein 1-like [Haliotis rufescens]
MKTEFMLASCASMCKRHKRCASFFHNSETRSCQAHSWTYRSKDYMNPRAGFKYYVQYTKGTGLRDCSEIQVNISSAADDTYTITPPDGQSPILAHCDLTHNGGGWTNTMPFISRALAATQVADALQNTMPYMFRTSAAPQVSCSVAEHYALHISGFSGDTGSSSLAEHYALLISVFSGATGNSMALHNGQAFSTRDRDLDRNTYGSCAQKYLGGWWYENCHLSNLNGEYNNTRFVKGINWESWRGNFYSLQTSVMKVRPVL